MYHARVRIASYNLLYGVYFMTCIIIDYSIDYSTYNKKDNYDFEMVFSKRSKRISKCFLELNYIFSKKLAWTKFLLGQLFLCDNFSYQLNVNSICFFFL